MEKVKSYKDLKIWQLGMEIVKDVYIFTRNFPKEEIYGLTSQLRRAAVSIPSNIAEGFNRYHTKEYQHFLRITLGSIAEVETQIIIAKELSFIDQKQLEELAEKLDHEGRMTSSLIGKLQSPESRTPSPEPRADGNS